MSTTRVHYVQQLLTHFDADPDRPAIVSGDVPFSAGQLADTVRRAAAAMARHDVGHRDVVCILTEPNTAATLTLQWAANLLGATAAHMRWVDPAGPEDELHTELQRAIGTDAGVRMLAVDQANEARARELLADTTDRPVLAVLGAGQPDAVDLTAGSGDGVAPCADITDSDLAVITQTRLLSGRNGLRWTFGVRNDMVSAAPSLPATGASATGPTTLLITAPLIHTDVFTAEDTLVTGGTVVLHPGFKAATVLHAIARHRITRLMLGAPQLDALAEHPDRAATDLSSLTELIYTGSPGVPLQLHKAREVFGPVLIQAYGTTETGVLTLLTPGDHDDPHACSTVGRPVHPDAVTIRHPDTGTVLPAGETGEVCAMPRWPTTGYWHEPELTEALVRDGWVRTGDLGHLDADGYLHLSGRLVNMMKVKGVHVYPEQVEKVLSQIPGVAQAAVCGVEDADRVEHIYAAVVPEPGAAVDPEELRRHVAEALSDTYVPRLIDIRRKLPTTGWGNPDRVRLRADARAALTRHASRV
ncbi:ANL family adenylate-forming protein [Streptomyces stackebrandtii]|uniref:ANL family adenylate-forming protein n=1 Tax=Streptomyces stackebrandtii TaxID=3051177 RepID=UPI0028DC6AC4|nr:fatty acid--CoA ligase family protein [Streptomyces sp. DSM 40976]